MLAKSESSRRSYREVKRRWRREFGGRGCEGRRKGKARAWVIEFWWSSRVEDGDGVGVGNGNGDWEWKWRRELDWPLNRGTNPFACTLPRTAGEWYWVQDLYGTGLGSDELTHTTCLQGLSPPRLYLVLGCRSAKGLQLAVEGGVSAADNI